MKKFIATYWKTLLFFAIVGLLGGFFVGLYLLNSYPAEIKDQLIGELEAAGLGDAPVDLLIAVTTAFQSLFYGAVLGAIGIYIAKAVGLWRDEISLERKPIIITAVASVIGGLALILPDVLFFGNYSEAIMNSYAEKPGIVYILATVTYGAIIEEVMMRLFAFSLVAFILHKIFGKGADKPGEGMMIGANIASALLFAIGHIPANIILLGASPLIIARCILLNGFFGLLYGWLYRKFGLRYAMIAHGGCHIVSKLIWVLFI